ncbi:hypothetical protein D1007_23410 [Hordeum vulgare]|nr:hypothetical protein D1007_23410 [Hordeum vulgare]
MAAARQRVVVMHEAVVGSSGHGPQGRRRAGRGSTGARRRSTSSGLQDRRQARAGAPLLPASSSSLLALLSSLLLAMRSEALLRLNKLEEVIHMYGFAEIGQCISIFNVHQTVRHGS